MIIARNPLSNPLFYPILIRLLLTFIATFPLVIVFNLKDLKSVFRSNIWKRYYAFFFIAPLYMFAIFTGGLVSLTLLFIVIVIALQEFQNITKLPKTYHYVNVFLGLVTVIVAAFYTRYFYSLPIIYYFILSLVPVFINISKKSLTNVSYSLFACIWICFSLAHFILTGYRENGLNMLILMGFAIVFSDVLAYVIGKLFYKIGFLDKKRIADQISPKKTFGGIIGNIIGAGLGIMISRFALPMFSLPSLIILAFIIGVFGLLGDLTESMVKRTFNVKDSSTLIPGHGGLLDRIDSAIRVIVVFYYYLVLFL